MKYKIILSGLIGNILEIYDISIYGFFASYFAKNFFGNIHNSVALTQTFLIFFAGFLARPVGALIFGKIGDKYGRKPALSSSILIMAFATGLIALLPTYKQVGILAPLALLFLKILQGISVGAEYTGSLIFLNEHARQNKKFAWTALAVMAINLGTLFASVVCYFIESHFSKQAMNDFAWRIPYLFSFLGALVAFFIRFKTCESHEFIHHINDISKNKYTNISNTKKLLLVMLLTGFGVTINYVFSVFIVTWMSTYLAYSLKNALLINNIGMLTVVISIPIFARIIKLDRLIYWLFTSVFIIVCSVIPYLIFIHTNKFFIAVLAQIFIMLPSACYFTVASYIIANIFPVKIRYSYSAISYNFSAAIFGGITPVFCLFLIKTTGVYFSPAFYIISVSILLLLNLYYAKLGSIRAADRKSST